MNVGLFGGSFNPPHVAHLIVAETVRDQFDLDHILWMPSYVPPHKDDEDLAAATHRLRMVERAVTGNPAFVVSDREIQRKGTSYTVETIAELQEAQPDVSFALIIGSDSLRAFGSWHRPEDIIDRVPLIVYKRPGASSSVAEPRFANRARFADAPLLDISGTEIRARCRSGHSIRYLVPESVRAYIDEHGLYT